MPPLRKLLFVHQILQHLSTMLALAFTFPVMGFLMMAAPTVAQFNLYPPVDPSKLSKALNISTDCIESLYGILFAFL